MPNRVFDNLQNLSELVIRERLLALDPTSKCYAFDAVNPATGLVLWHYIGVDSSIPDDQVVSLLSASATVQESSDLGDYSTARSSFLNLPNWATWSDQDAVNYINSNILNGMTQAQVDSYINSNTVNTVLHQVGTALINIRTILSAMAQAVIFIRNLVIRFGR